MTEIKTKEAIVLIVRGYVRTIQSVIRVRCSFYQTFLFQQEEQNILLQKVDNRMDQVKIHMDDFFALIPKLHAAETEDPESDIYHNEVVSVYENIDTLKKSQLVFEKRFTRLLIRRLQQPDRQFPIDKIRDL